MLENAVLLGTILLLLCIAAVVALLIGPVPVLLGIAIIIGVAIWQIA